MGTQAGRAADPIVEALADRIRYGQLANGAPLPPERDLMEEFGVSRGVAREAILSLAMRGLVDARPRHRPIVRKPGFDAAADAIGGVITHLLGEPDGVRNLFETRILIESALVRQAALGARREHMAALKEALAANEAAIDEDAAYHETDKAFHAVFYDMPGNPALPALFKAYASWLSPQWSRMPRNPARNRENHLAHREIYDAIQMRDPDAAEAALRAHLSGAWAQVRATFGDI